MEEFVISEYNAERKPFHRAPATQKDKYILPDFPFKYPADLQLFELDCATDKDLVLQLKNKFMEIGGQDASKFIRRNLKNLLTDEAALPYSWHGHRGNIAVCNFVSMEALIETCQQHFPQSVTLEIVKPIKMWFQYAADRIKKRTATTD